MFCSFLQPQKAYWPSSLRFEGNFTVSRLEQLLKADVLIVVTLSGILTLLSSSQF